MQLSSIKRWVKKYYFGVQRDPSTGHFYYLVGNIRVYIRTPDECEQEKHREFALNQIYFKHYFPSGKDCVVDFGAGLGTEIVGLARKSPDLNYIAVEIQPSVYECLSLTLSQLKKNFVPYGLAVGEGKSLDIAPTHFGIDASTLDGTGRVPVEMVDWPRFVQRHGIARVDLLKVNIEGGEVALLEHIDLSIVRRIIVSVHDFRADRGDGEHFRTRTQVEARLRSAGYSLTPLQGPQDWMRSWIFAERA